MERRLILKVGGLLHLFGPPKRLQIGHLLRSHIRRIPNILNLVKTLHGVF
jgi:hypothetical protein